MHNPGRDVALPLERFPPMPPALADHYLAISDPEPLIEAPHPWDVGELPTDLAAEVLAWLDHVCGWLNRTYAWQPHQIIPPCWRDHHHLVHEIAALAFARFDAYRDPGSTVAWHEQYDRFLHRTAATLGADGEQCRIGRHTSRPSRYHLAAWGALTSDNTTKVNPYGN
ncbi:hypothetical protein E0L36_23135 [Streptomyces sp. AJS327]|uniref:hypothetical protein n=1 Tax=Streptomyces sp. AJS327 TaxID=2545265 RepID=UPI0015DEF598|nr:hypothetical protein [Streptomyces sp. AJS327]MBA0053654.1 hypothetical protein [Streptomyces sp. AJS327]